MLLAVAACGGSAVAPARAPASPPPDAAELTDTDLLTPASLAGRWTVSGVELVQGPVQAYAVDDPAYLGRSLVIGPQKIAWATPEAQGATLSDVCGRPELASAGGTLEAVMSGASGPAPGLKPDARRAAAYRVGCDSGRWGPEPGALLARTRAGQLVLTWYDGVVLLLDRRA